MRDRDRRIIELYQSGLTMRATGEAFGITRTRVWQILVDNGIERRPAPRAWSCSGDEGKAAISRKNSQHGAAKRKARGLDDVLELLESGMTRRQIAEAKGLSYNAVCGLVWRESCRSGIARHNRRPDRGAIRDLLRAGVSQRQIIKRLRVSWATVISVAREGLQK